MVCTQMKCCKAEVCCSVVHQHKESVKSRERRSCAARVATAAQQLLFMGCCDVRAAGAQSVLVQVLSPPALSSVAVAAPRPLGHSCSRSPMAAPRLLVRLLRRLR